MEVIGVFIGVKSNSRRGLFYKVFWFEPSLLSNLFGKGIWLKTMTLQNCLHLNGSGELIFEARDLPSPSMQSWDPDGSDETLPAQIGGGHQLTDFSKTAAEPWEKSITLQKMSSGAQTMGLYGPGNHSKWPSGSPSRYGTLEIKIRVGRQMTDFWKTDSHSKNSYFGLFWV